MSNQPENNNGRPSDERLRQYKQFIDKYKEEAETHKELWKIYTQNVLSDDFKYSRWAGLALIFVPLATNFFFYYRPDFIFKNTIRISVFAACYFNLQHQLNQDFAALVKKDTPIANIARQHIQKLAQNDIYMPDFARETIEIYSKAN
jgi:hypothetical protein